MDYKVDLRDVKFQLFEWLPTAKLIEAEKFADWDLENIEMVLDEGQNVRSHCEKLMGMGMLCKDTHETAIRFAPPLTITREELDWALERIEKVLSA